MNWILVTGDTGGLGRAIVDRILEKTEYGVIGISRRGADEAHRLAQYSDRNYVHLSTDLSHPEHIKKLYLEEVRKIGRLAGLVNNAATAYDDIVTNMQMEPLERMFRTNVYSPMMLTKYALRDMLASGIHGSIVHISSVSAHTGYKGLAMYAATKGALEAFSRTVAREWGSRGIRSNIIAPGFMETDISASLTDEQRKKIYQRTSLKCATQIDSVAESVLFLLSDASKSITGSVLSVDNGTI